MAQGKEHGSEKKTLVRHEQNSKSSSQQRNRDLFVLLLRANYKHVQLTLSTCIVSDSVKRFNVLVDEILI